MYRTIVRLPFELIPFVFSMFTIVLSLDYVGVTSQLGKVLSVADSTYLFGALSVLVSNIINNIPMSVFFSSILDNVTLVGNEYLKVSTHMHIRISWQILMLQTMRNMIIVLQEYMTEQQTLGRLHQKLRKREFTNTPGWVRITSLTLEIATISSVQPTSVS